MPFIRAVIPPRTYYTTAFPATENPVSEGGAWLHHSPDETVVQTELIGGVHVAHGTQAGGGFDDSNAYITGFAPSHTIQGTVWRSASLASTPNAEIELLLSWSDENARTDFGFGYGSTACRGYEINWDQNGSYMILGRFKRAELTRAANFGSTPVSATGDIFKAQFVRNANGSADITVWVNGSQVMTYHDTDPEPAGCPGIGFYIDSGQNNAHYGFSSVTATSP